MSTSPHCRTCTDPLSSGCFTDSTSEANWGAYQRWDVPAQGARGFVKSKGQFGLCLDAGDNPTAGSGLKVWDCLSGVPQQDWAWGGEILSLNNGQVLHTDPNSGSSYSKPYIYDYELVLGNLDKYNQDLTQRKFLGSVVNAANSDSQNSSSRRHKVV